MSCSMYKIVAQKGNCAGYQKEEEEPEPASKAGEHRIDEPSEIARKIPTPTRRGR